MQGDEIRRLEHLVDAGRASDLRRQAPGGVDRDLGVVAEHVHAELDRRVGDQATDLAQADHAQRAAGQLVAGEALLAVLDRLVHVGNSRVKAGDKAQRRCDVARGQQHAGEHEFLDRVGVGARGVEDRHAARAHQAHRNVVGACAGAADGAHAVGDRLVVQVGRAQQQRVRRGDVRADRVQLGRQARQAIGRNLVEDADAETAWSGGAISHAWPRIRACRPPAPARRPRALRCRSTPACRRPSGGPSTAACRAPRRPPRRRCPAPRPST